ncbi:asparagine synthetase B family protein [Ancylobacter dichloromethanicus]|uniref:asparagine synthetase B family protein n=1 Tax=Ancylobacter dichloromethanicus TaxID=518825 RepID=UPI0036116AC4
MLSPASLLLMGARFPRICLEMIVSTPRPNLEQARVWKNGCAALIRFPPPAMAEPGRDSRPSDAASESVICFDGRLDNRSALFALLGNRRAELRDAPDGEIALALFDLLGDRFLDALLGDFAFAIWQPQVRRLLCARSPTGWRPLLWTFDGNMLAFGTEPATLVKGLDLKLGLNEGLIGEILSARFVSATDTLWQGLHRLAPGCALDFRDGTPRIRQWYDEAYEDLSRLSDAEHVEQFNHLFNQALVSCTRSKRPIAAHLSGGLDSSSVFARAIELRRSGAIDQDVGAISVRYPGQPQDETAWSGAVEEHLGISARVVGDAPFDFDAARNWCTNSLHLPVRPNTMGPTQSACALMHKRDERVLLTGEGGDDWLNGTRAHWPDLLLRGDWGKLLSEAISNPGCSVPQNLRMLVSASIGPIVSKARRDRLKRPFLQLDAPMPEWISKDWAMRTGLRDRWHDALPKIDFPNFAQMPRHAVIAQPYRELIFDPIQTMAAQYGVEQRHPLHDLRLLRFFMGAAGGMLLRSGERKHLLREAMRGTLPEVVRTRKTKAHFSAPIIDALAQAFDRRPPQEMRVVQMGWVDGDAIARLFEEHRQWRREGCAGAFPNNALAGLWFCFAVDLWLENAFRI